MPNSNKTDLGHRHGLAVTEEGLMIYTLPADNWRRCSVEWLFCGNDGKWHGAYSMDGAHTSVPDCTGHEPHSRQSQDVGVPVFDY